MSSLNVQQYLFDLHGSLVIDDVLTCQEVSELNRLIDESGLTSTRETAGRLPGGGAGEEGAGFLEWGQAFTRLLAHPKVMPVLRLMLGDGFRIDHFWGAWANAGAAALPLHGGVVPFVQTDYYYVRDGKIRSGLTNVAWNLTDSGGDLGGFMALPGSHKSNFELPQELKEATEAYGITVPEVKAGSVSIFTEALLHGTPPCAAPTSEGPCSSAWGRLTRRTPVTRRYPQRPSSSPSAKSCCSSHPRPLTHSTAPRSSNPSSTPPTHSSPIIPREGARGRTKLRRATCLPSADRTRQTPWSGRSGCAFLCQTPSGPFPRRGLTGVGIHPHPAEVCRRVGVERRPDPWPPGTRRAAGGGCAFRVGPHFSRPSAQRELRRL